MSVTAPNEAAPETDENTHDYQHCVNETPV